MGAAAAVDQLDAIGTARHHPAALFQRLAQELLLVLPAPPLGIAAAPDQPNRHATVLVTLELDSRHFQTLYDGRRAVTVSGLTEPGEMVKNTCILG
jgi:hypothetical protein